MNFVSKVTGWFNRRGGKGDLQQNMEKALAMKQEAGPQTSIPEHQTRHEGGVGGEQMSMTDADAGSQGSYQPKLKRSRVARSGDT
jgi:hypothetical protein